MESFDSETGRGDEKMSNVRDGEKSLHLRDLERGINPSLGTPLHRKPVIDPEDEEGSVRNIIGEGDDLPHNDVDEDGVPIPLTQLFSQ